MGMFVAHEPDLVPGTTVTVDESAEVPWPEEDFRVSFDSLVTDDITWAEEIGVFADISRCDNGVMNLAFESDVVRKVDVGVEGHSLNIALSKVRIGIEPSRPYLNRAKTRSRRQSLAVQHGCHPEEAGARDADDLGMPLQQVPPSEEKHAAHLDCEANWPQAVDQCGQPCPVYRLPTLLGFSSAAALALESLPEPWLLQALQVLPYRRPGELWLELHLAEPSARQALCSS